MDISIIKKNKWKEKSFEEYDHTKEVHIYKLSIPYNIKSGIYLQFMNYLDSTVIHE